MTLSRFLVTHQALANDSDVHSTDAAGGVGWPGSSSCARRRGSAMAGLGSRARRRGSVMASLSVAAATPGVRSGPAVLGDREREGPQWPRVIPRAGRGGSVLARSCAVIASSRPENDPGSRAMRGRGVAETSRSAPRSRVHGSGMARGHPEPAARARRGRSNVRRDRASRGPEWPRVILDLRCRGVIAWTSCSRPVASRVSRTSRPFRTRDIAIAGVSRSGPGGLRRGSFMTPGHSGLLDMRSQTTAETRRAASAAGLS